MESSESAMGTALCAVHADAQATGTCERCGNFVCPLCLDVLSSFSERCESCRERAGADRIAWERPEGSWAKRFLQTTRDVLLRPSKTIEESAPGSVGSSILYVALLGAAEGLVLAVIVGCLMLGVMSVLPGEFDDMSAPMLGGIAAGASLVAAILYPVMFAGFFVVATLVRGLVYHAAVAMLGGRGGIAPSLWITGYLHVVHVLQIPLMVLGQIPIVGPFITLLAFLAFEIWFGVHLTTAARRHHGLEGGRAAAAGWFPFLVVVMLGTLCCVGTFLLVTTSGPPRS